MAKDGDNPMEAWRTPRAHARRQDTGRTCRQAGKGPGRQKGARARATAQAATPGAQLLAKKKQQGADRDAPGADGALPRKGDKQGTRATKDMPTYVLELAKMEDLGETRKLTASEKEKQRRLQGQYRVFNEARKARARARAPGAPKREAPS